ncbi:MAG: L-lactate dehydrogenase, partial [uncultured Actinomycetospora sp.]
DVPSGVPGTRPHGPPATAPGGAAPAAAPGPPRARSRAAAPRARPHRRRPARDRAPPHPAGRLRLHRRGGGGRGVAEPGAGRVRRAGVPAPGAARRLAHRHLDDHARRALGTAVRVRPHRVHPDDAPRRRAGGGARRGPDRGAAHPLDHGHHVARGPRRGRARHAALVPALPLARPGGEPGDRATCRGGRQRGDHADRGHPGRGAPPARRPQRADHPAGPHGADAVRHGAPPALVAQPALHGAAGVRGAHVVGGHGRRAHRLDLRPGADPRRPHVAPIHVERPARGEGRADRRGRPAGGRRGRRRGDRVQPRRAPARSRTRPPRDAALGGRRGRRRGRGPARHGHHVGRGHRRRRRARRLGLPGRPGVPLRADGRRREGRRAPRDDAHRGDPPDDGAARGVVGQGAHPRPRAATRL